MFSKKTFEKIDGRAVEFVFDIASGGISGAIVYFQKGKRPEIMYSVIRPIEFEEELSILEFKRLSLTALNIVCQKMISEGLPSFEIRDMYKDHKKPDRANLFFSSPWVHSKIKKTKKRSTDKKGKEKIKDIFKQIMSREESTEEGLILINRTLSSLKINGYNIPGGFFEEVSQNEASLVEVSTIESFISELDLKKIEGVIQSNFNLEHFHEYPFHVPFRKMIQENFYLDENYLFADTTSEMSEVFLVQANAVRSNFSFPFGRNSIARALVKEGIVSSVNQATSFLSVFMEKHLDSEINKRAFLIIEQESEHFNLFFQKVLQKIPEKNIPEILFLVSDRKVNYFFKNSIQKMYPKLKIILIDQKKLEKYCTVRKEEFWDNFLALEASFLE